MWGWRQCAQFVPVSVSSAQLQGYWFNNCCTCQVISPVAHLQFVALSYRNTYGPRGNYLRVQSTCWYFRSLHGYWSDIWKNGRDPCQSTISVRMMPFGTLQSSISRVTPHLFWIYRAYPQSGIFKFCTPDVPCITPGTYAFLGAAAALRYD